MFGVRFGARAVALFVAIAAVLLLPGAGAFAQCLPSTGANSANGSGWVAGGHAGYNWQRDSWVFGLEADLSASSLKSSMSGGIASPGPCLGDAASARADVDWFGTVRGRVGWTTDRAMFYGTGGFAYGEVDLRSSYSSGVTSLNSETSPVRAGWVVGGGIDYLLQPNLILNLGYQYVDLGTVSLIASLPPLTQTASAHAAFHVVTVGLSWRFSPTGQGPSKPWEGLYIGGHAGGAWGLDTDARYSAAAAISDVRLKRDVVLVSRRDDGLGLYRYRYLWDDTVYVGVLAQEVALLYPDAVVRDDLDSYLRVDYRRLGLRLMTMPEWNARSAGAQL